MPGFWSYLYLKLGTFSTELQVKNNFLQLFVIFHSLVHPLNDIFIESIIKWDLTLPEVSRKPTLKIFHQIYTDHQK